MTNDVYRIVYCSRNLISAEGTGSSQETELERILTAARTNNVAESVTGALLFNHECFAQVLEGPRASVERIFEKIQRDRRHGQVTVVDNGWAGQRDFPEWAMAHAQPCPGEQEEGIASMLQMAMVQPSSNGTAVLDLLKSLVIPE